jgi:phosphohistidine phosphatase
VQARAAGIAIELLHSGFEQVLFSPKVRAHETAELAAEGWDPQQRELLRVHPPLAGGFDAAQALDAISGIGADGRLLMVGHEPDLSHVIGQLTGGRVDVKKGGLAIVRLDVNPAHPASGELVALMRPRELVLIAGGVGGVPIHGE